jgi:hypothetical protein
VEIGNKIHKDYQEILIKAMSSGWSHIVGILIYKINIEPVKSPLTSQGNNKLW